VGLRLVSLVAGGIVANLLFGRVVQASERSRALREAYSYARRVKKRVLNAGCGSLPPYGDVNLDITPLPVPNFVLGNIEDMPFEDKEFGACVASHVLEHVDDPKRALEECHRVADRVWIIAPPWWDAGTWLTPTHRWIIVKSSPLKYRPYTPLPAWFITALALWAAWVA